MLCQHWTGIFRARSTDIRNDQAEMMLAFFQPMPRDLIGLFGWMSFRSFFPPNVNLLVAQMDCSVACTALQEALGPNFYSTLTRQFCRHRLSLLAFGASRTVFFV